MKLRKGFTLIELLIVVLILGALAAIAIPRITESADTARRNACQTNIDIINSQVEIFAARTGGYPDTIAAMILADPNSFPDGAPLCPVSPFPAYALGADHRVVAATHAH